MENTYEKCRAIWDGIFAKETVGVPVCKDTGNAELDAGLDWLSDGTSSVLDFGCGNGSMLFFCALRGTKRHLGVDISQEGVDLANRRAESMGRGEYDFRQGGVDALETLEDSLFDGAILSNIIDNLIPKDAQLLYKQVKRVLKPQGKLLVKLNPFLTEEQIKEWEIKVIEGNLLDDGLLLWNRRTEDWSEMFAEDFAVVQYRDIYYEKHQQYNRMFLMVKK